jgi:methionine-rich copper-binding protein CopC
MLSTLGISMKVLPCTTSPQPLKRANILAKDYSMIKLNSYSGKYTMSKKLVLLGILSVLLLTLAAPSGFSHSSSPVNASPAPDSLQESLPKLLTLEFVDKLQPSTGEVSILDPSGALISGATTQEEKKLITEFLPKPEQYAGVYIVNFRVISQDGTLIQKNYSFTLTQGTEYSSNSNSNLGEVEKTPLGKNKTPEPNERTNPENPKISPKQKNSNWGNVSIVSGLTLAVLFLYIIKISRKRSGNNENK